MSRGIRAATWLTQGNEEISYAVFVAHSGVTRRIQIAVWLDCAEENATWPMTNAGGLPELAGTR